MHQADKTSLQSNNLTVTAWFVIAVKNDIFGEVRGTSLVGAKELRRISEGMLSGHRLD